MGHGVKVLMHLDACGEFAITFLQNHTVKMFEKNRVIVRITVNRNQLNEQANL